MGRIVSVVTIARPIEEVFEFASTPGNWPLWHPSSRSVGSGAEHPLRVGERCTEEFVVAGHHGTATWTVHECDPPRRWTIDGKAKDGGTATISYALTQIAAGTRFERTLQYTMPTWWLRLLEPLAIRGRVTAESAEALRRLKGVLENRNPQEPLNRS